MKDIYVVGEKMARKGRKTVIYQSQILENTLFLSSLFPQFLTAPPLKVLTYSMDGPLNRISIPRIPQLESFACLQRFPRFQAMLEE